MPSFISPRPRRRLIRSPFRLPPGALVLLALLAGALPGPPGRAQPAAARRSLPASIGPVGGSSSTVPAALRGGVAPRVVRTLLSHDEESAALEFEVALAMRSFPELEQRLARGEQIAPEEMAASYYPRPETYEAVAAWLTDSGFTLTLRDPNRLAIFATGSVAQVAQGLQVSFARVAAEDGEYTSAITAPTAPVGVAPALVGINGLQPHLHPRKHALLASPVVKNSFTGNGPPFLPSQLAHAYHADGLSVTGAGQKIAIVIDTFPATSDVTTFWSVCGINQSAANLEYYQVVSGTLPATSGEETLDVEWASALAPGAKVRVYATLSLSFINLDKAYRKIITDLPSQPSLHQVSLSYGAGETYVSTSQIITDAQYFATLASNGVSVLVSSGDGGSTPGTSGHDHTGPTQAEYPASDASVTAVGGTSLTVDATTGDTTSETAWYDGGGGVSAVVTRPSWQTGTGVPAGTKRCVPDVALAADPATGGILVWNNAGYIVGGTSWSAPAWAGLVALLNEARTNAGLASAGLLGPRLYPLLGSASLVDITGGSNGPSGVYNAGPGYDLCTGVGVPSFSTLLATLSAVAPAVGTQPQNVAVNAGQPATFSITATGTAPLTYQWQVSADGGNTWTALTDNGTTTGTATATLQLAATPASLSGSRFRCVITNAAGQVRSNSATLTVTSPPAITSPATAAGTYGQAFAYTITATNAPTSFAASGLPGGLAPTGTSGLISGTPAAAGSFSATVSATNSAGTGTAPLTVTISPAPAAVTLSNLSATYDGHPHPATATTSPGGLTVSLQYDGSTTAPANAGSYAVTATVTSPNYAGSATGALTISPASQVITFAPLDPTTVGAADITLTATASSGLPVTYQSDNPAVASVSGATVTVHQAGTAQVTATQGGDGNHTAAAPVSQSLIVNAAPPDPGDVPLLPAWALAALALALLAAARPALRRT